MNYSMPGLPVHHQLPEFTQTHVHWASDAIQPSHPLFNPTLLAPLHVHTSIPCVHVSISTPELGLHSWIAFCSVWLSAFIYTIPSALKALPPSPSIYIHISDYLINPYSLFTSVLASYCCHGSLNSRRPPLSTLKLKEGGPNPRNAVASRNWEMPLVYISSKNTEIRSWDHEKLNSTIHLSEPPMKHHLLTAWS